MTKNRHTLLRLIENCKTMRELRQLHGFMITTAQVRDVIPLSRLIDLCVNPDIANLNYANSIFLQIEQPSIFMWNSMIRGFSYGDEQDRALSMCKEMQQLGYSPDHFTFPFVLRACAKIPDHKYGKCVHTLIVKTGFESDLYVSSTMIHMYVSCGDVEAGRRVFEKIPKRNVVAWSTLIAGYVDNGEASEAMRLFKQMELANVEPNEITMVNVLVASAQMRDLETGTWVHRYLHQIGIDPFPSCSNLNPKPNIILQTALLDMYAKCGSLKTARNLFDNMTHRNVVSWNSMIGAYSQYIRATEALRLFLDMRLEGEKPDEVTFLSLLSACTQLGALTLGRAIHACTIKTNIDKDVVVGTSLVDMYGKTGDTNSACGTFKNLKQKDVKAWTSMIIGLAMHGNGVKALGFFREMQREDIIPDHITYIGVLCACSHTGLIEEGIEHFNSMRNVHGIVPTIEHYGCMVDLLSRAGHLEEAKRLVDSMPIPPNSMIWGALLSGCEIHGNADMAGRLGDCITQLNPRGSGVYVLLSNIYAKAGSWQGVEITRELMRHKGIEKTCGFSAVEKLLNP